MKETSNIEQSFLEEAITRINSLVMILQSGLHAGMSITVSPIEPLVDAMIDISLIIGTLISKGAPWKDSANKDIKFIDSFDKRVFEQSGIRVGTTDALGNPQQVKFRKPKGWLQSIEAGRWFRQLSRILVSIKQGLPSRDFMSHIEKLLTLIPKQEIRSPTVGRTTHKKNTAKPISKASYFYYRRHKKRSTS